LTKRQGQQHQQHQLEGSSTNSTSYMNSSTNNRILNSKELVQQARLVAPTPASRRAGRWLLP
jgi:hypothetical protein